MKLISTLLAAAAAITATSAYAQEYNETVGGLDGPAVVTDVGDPVITQEGDLTVDPYTNTFTSVQDQEATTTGSGGTFVSTTVNGFTYFGSMSVSGEGSQSQTTTSGTVTTYDPDAPDAPPVSVPFGPTVALVGDPEVTAVSASGFVGATPRYSSTLSTSGEVVDNAVVATSNSSLLNSAGITFEQRIGTATYDPTSGEVTVELPEDATSSTSITATGISTTGSLTSASLDTGAISATSLDMNGGRITNLGAGTATTDAVNLGQLNSAVSALTASIGTTNVRIDSLASLVADNQRRADAGTAVATALSGGTFLPGKAINFTANVGHYRGETAVSAQLGALISENVAINAGVATGLNSYGGTAIRGGFTFGF